MTWPSNIGVDVVARAMRGISRPAAAHPAAARTCSAAAFAQQHEADDGLGVLRGGKRAVEVGQRPADDLDALALDRLRVGILGEPGGQDDVDLLVHHADRRVERGQRLPVLGLQADLLGELARRGGHDVLALLELAGGELERVRVVDRLARLADEDEIGLVVADDPHRARVVDDRPLGLLAVGEAEPGELDGDERAVVDGLAAELLEAAVSGAHAARRSRSDKVTSSMPSSAATDTRSSLW